MTDTSRQNIDIITKYARFKYGYCFIKPQIVNFLHDGKQCFVVTTLSVKPTSHSYQIFVRENRIGSSEKEAVELYLKFIFNGTESLNSMKMKLAIAGKL